MPSIPPKFGSAAVRRLLIEFVVLGCLVITTLTMLSVPLDQLLTASRIGDARNKLKSDNSSSDPMPRASSSSDQEPKSVAYVISLFSAPLNPDKSPANDSQILSSLRNEDAGGTLRIAADLIVLAESIRRATAHSAHRADLVALVRRSLLPATHDVLDQLGFRIIPTEVVVPPEDIVGEDGRAHATGDTSFGGKYLISDENDKLLIYNLTEYDRVVSLDTDAVMVQPIDELFDHAEETQGTLDYYGLGDDEPDHPEGGFKQAVVPAINGGFVVVRPSREAFAGILDIYKRGDFSLEQVDGYMGGWDHIGTGYYYGGISFQGLLPAYYFRDALLNRPPNTTRYQAAQKALKVPEGRQFRELDQCVYNVLGHRNCWGREGGVQGTSYCRNVDCSPDVNPTIEGVKAGLKVIHFTGTCRGARPMDLCRAPAVELGGNCELCKEFVRRWLGIAESALASENQSLYRQLAPDLPDCVEKIKKAIF